MTEHTVYLPTIPGKRAASERIPIPKNSLTEEAKRRTGEEQRTRLGYNHDHFSASPRNKNHHHHHTLSSTSFLSTSSQKKLPNSDFLHFLLLFLFIFISFLIWLNSKILQLESEVLD